MGLAAKATCLPAPVVLFKSPSIWEQHRGTVLAVLFVFGLQTMLVVRLLIQRRRRQRAEDLLKESEERMTFTAASANIGLWQIDRETNELWATEHCRAMFGLASDVPLTREAFLAAVHPEDVETAKSRQSQGLRNGAACRQRRAIVLPDDQVRWIRMRARPIRRTTASQSNWAEFSSTSRTRKPAEAEAALQRQEVAHLMRVSVLGELSGSIAHEINQPLTAILSNAQAALHLLAQKSPDLAEIRDALQDIVHEDNRAGEVIHRLRNLLKKGERKSESVNINDLVNSTVALLNSELIGREIGVRSIWQQAVPDEREIRCSCSRFCSIWS